MIFVFGSNLAGRHGKGAAKEALNNWGAIYGKGEGRQGDSYAIATKDANLFPLDLGTILQSIYKFFDYAKDHEDEIFMFTPVGTGLAGYHISDLTDNIDFTTVPSNVLFTASWFK